MTMFANLYRAMAKVGLPDPRRVDELQLWEAAVLLGADEYVDDDDEFTDNVHARRGSPHEHLHRDLAYREAMAKWAAGEGPQPDASLKYEWGEPDGDAMELANVLSSGSSLE